MKTLIAFLCLAGMTACAFAQDDKLPTIASKVDKLQKIDGYMPLYCQASSGKLFMEIGRFNQELLYQVSLPAGLGSNPVGLDRGQLGDSSVVVFERVGPKVLMTQPNYAYRAITSNEAERRAVKESFAQSVLWGFSFPKNSEIETTLTFTTDGDPGRYVRQAAPAPTAVTLREHHSFVELPDFNYKPRKLDPRAPSFGIQFYDYASPIDEHVEKRWIVRHRLEKKDPSALQPQRAARTIEQHGRDAAVPGFGDIVSSLVQKTWSAPRAADGYGQAVQEAVQSLVVTRLMDLAADASASPQVRAQASAGLRRIKTIAATIVSAHALEAREDITRFLSRPADTYKKTDPLPTPPGEPIGGKGGR